MAVGLICYCNDGCTSSSRKDWERVHVSLVEDCREKQARKDRYQKDNFASLSFLLGPSYCPVLSFALQPEDHLALIRKATNPLPDDALYLLNRFLYYKHY